MPPPPPGGREHRETERFELIAQIEVQRDSSLLLLPASNISAGGMFIEAVASELVGINVGASVTVHLDIGNDADGEPLEITAPAEVIRIANAVFSDPTGFAVIWTSRDPEFALSMARILRYLRDLSTAQQAVPAES